MPTTDTTMTGQKRTHAFKACVHVSKRRPNRLGLTKPKTAPKPRSNAHQLRNSGSTREPEPGSRHLYAGRRPAGRQVTSRLLPKRPGGLGFGYLKNPFDPSSVVRFRSPSWPTPDAITARLFPNAQHHGS